MHTRGVKVTGNSQIDCATSEIAGHIRDGRVGSHVKWAEQDHYDEAMRLRDEIMKGTRALPPEPIPADVTPTVITDDIALNMAANVLEAYKRPETAAMLRRMLPGAEGRVNGKPYQEQTGKWGSYPTWTGPGPAPPWYPEAEALAVQPDGG